jgi:hypothetical protein
MNTPLIPVLIICGYFFLCLWLAYDLGQSNPPGCCWTRPEEGPREPDVGREGRLKRDAARAGRRVASRPATLPPGNGLLPSRLSLLLGHRP